MKATVTKLLDEIEKILKRDKRTVADLATDLSEDNERDFSYQQVYDWIRRRQFNPQADALLALMNWRDKHKISARAKRAVRVQPVGAGKD